MLNPNSLISAIRSSVANRDWNGVINLSSALLLYPEAVEASAIANGYSADRFSRSTPSFKAHMATFAVGEGDLYPATVESAINANAYGAAEPMVSFW